MNKLFVCVVSLLALAYNAMSSPANAINKPTSIISSRSILGAGDYVWLGATNNEPVVIKINLLSQMLYVTQGDKLIGATNISSGKDGFDSPVGSFSVLGKEDNHWSKKYKADMPFTMWITDDGVALHSGVTPGRKTSHGCIHLPHGFAKVLYPVVDKNTSITVHNPKTIEGLTLKLK